MESEHLSGIERYSDLSSSEIQGSASASFSSIRSFSWMVVMTEKEKRSSKLHSLKREKRKSKKESFCCETAKEQEMEMERKGEKVIQKERNGWVLKTVLKTSLIKLRRK